MNRVLVGATLVVLAAGCGSSDDQRTVAGRTGSQASAVTSAEQAARVERTRTRDPATGVVTGRLRVEVRGAGLTRATLRAPSGQEAALVADGDLLSVEGDDAGPLGGPGQYALLGTFASGTATSIVVVGDAFPEPAAVVAPAEGATGVSLQPTVVWSSSERRNDLRVVEAATGVVVHRVQDLVDTSWRVPPGALAARTRYRVEVHACDGPAGAAARLAAGSAATFETGAGP